VERSDCDHYEVETYTWGVTPDEAKDDLVTMLGRELEWTQTELGAR